MFTRVEAVALFYEKEIKSDAKSRAQRHYVQAGTILVGVYVTKSSYLSGDGPQMRYYHRITSAASPPSPTNQASIH